MRLFATAGAAHWEELTAASHRRGLWVTKTKTWRPLYWLLSHIMHHMWTAEQVRHDKNKGCYHNTARIWAQIRYLLGSTLPSTPPTSCTLAGFNRQQNGRVAESHSASWRKEKRELWTTPGELIWMLYVEVKKKKKKKKPNKPESATLHGTMNSVHGIMNSKVYSICGRINTGNTAFSKSDQHTGAARKRPESTDGRGARDAMHMRLDQPSLSSGGEVEAGWWEDLQYHLLPTWSAVLISFLSHTVNLWKSDIFSHDAPQPFTIHAWPRGLACDNKVWTRLEGHLYSQRLPHESLFEARRMKSLLTSA